MQVKIALPYRVRRGIPWRECFAIATNKWIVSCVVRNYVDQSETCMIVLCASIYMEYLHTYANVGHMYETKCYMNLVLTKIQVSSIEEMEIIVEHHHPTCVWLYNANGYNVTKQVTQT